MDNSITVWETGNPQTTLLSSSIIQDDATNEFSLCVDSSLCYNVTIEDSFGDGLYETSNPHVYEIELEGVLRAWALAHRFEAATELVGGGCDTEYPSISPTSSTYPTWTPTVWPSAGPSAGPSVLPSIVSSDVPSDVPSEMPSDVPSGMPSNAPCPSLDIAIHCDSFCPWDSALLVEEEGSHGSPVLSIGFLSDGVGHLRDDEANHFSICIEPSACYNVTIVDAFGDGLTSVPYSTNAYEISLGDSLEVAMDHRSFRAVSHFVGSGCA